MIVTVCESILDPQAGTILRRQRLLFIASCNGRIDTYGNGGNNGCSLWSIALFDVFTASFVFQEVSVSFSFCCQFPLIRIWQFSQLVKVIIGMSLGARLTSRFPNKVPIHVRMHWSMSFHSHLL